MTHAKTMNAKDPDFTILALKCITGIARDEEKTRLDILLENRELKHEYEELAKIVNIVSELRGIN